MKEKNTQELGMILKSTHADNFKNFIAENRGSLKNLDCSFSEYVKDIVKGNGLTLSNVFLFADISERYGYKLLSGEKKTRQRDVILRICYAAGMDLEGTQKALKLYGMPELYPRFERDALLMVLFNDHKGSIIDVNAALKENGFEPLRPSGVQE